MKKKNKHNLISETRNHPKRNIDLLLDYPYLAGTALVAINSIIVSCPNLYLATSACFVVNITVAYTLNSLPQWLTRIIDKIIGHEQFKEEDIIKDNSKEVVLIQEKRRNRERLEGNLRDNKVFIEEYLGKNPKEKPSDEDLRDLFPRKDEFTFKKINQEVFAKSIHDLTILRDERIGIVWSIKKNTDKSRHIIRDARNVEYNQEKGIPSLDSIESYFIQQLNIGRSALFMLDTHLEKAMKCKDDKAEAMLKLARQKLSIYMVSHLDTMYKQLDNALSKQIYSCSLLKDATLNFNKAICNIIASSGIKDFQKELNATKDQMAIFNEHFHFSTITNVVDENGNKFVKVESDTLYIGLTEEQKSNFLFIKKNKNNPDEILSSQEYEWYTEQSEYQNKLTDLYIKAALESKPVRLSSQVMSILPTLRNAALTTTMIKAHNAESLVTISEHSHSGVPAYLGKGDQELITQQNVDQLLSFMPEDTKVNVTMLISPANIISEEPKLAKLMRCAQGIEVTSTPFNILRFAQTLGIIGSANDYKSYLDTLKFVGNKLIDKKIDNLTAFDNEVRRVAQYLVDGKDYEIAKNSLEEMEKMLKNGSKDDKSLYTTLECAVEAKRLIDHPSFIFDYTDNLNLVVNDLMNEVQNSAHLKNGGLRRYCGNEITNIVPMTHSHCKSGKDREGVNRFYHTFQAINRILGIKKESHAYEANLKSQAVGSHTQFSADIYTGTQGIQKDSYLVQPNYFKGTIKGLIQNTAAMNKFMLPKTIGDYGKYLVGVAITTTIMCSTNNPYIRATGMIIDLALLYQARHLPQCIKRNRETHAYLALSV